MMDTQKFCLKWDGFQSSVTSVFDHLRQDGELVDITLCCEGQQVRAHRMMLSACSPYFRDLLKNNPCQQMVFFLKDTSAADLRAVIEFMYKGSVNVAQSQLASFIKTAEMLQIKGLSGDDDKPAPSSPVSASQRSSAARPDTPDSRAPPPHRPHRNGTPPAKRRRSSGPAEPPPPPPPPPPVSYGQLLPQPSSPLPPPPAVVAAASPGVAAASPGQSPAGCAVPQSPAGGGGQPPPEPPAPAEGAVKIEKVDLTEEDDDVALDATLGYVAEYEGGGYEEPPDLSAGAMADATTVMGGVPGPSQRPSEDGAQPDQIKHVCNVCGKVYKHRESLNHHKKKHEGLTTCFVCGKVCCIVAELRRHLELVHGLTQEQVRRIVPTKPKERIAQSPHRVSGVYRPQSAGSQNISPMPMAKAMELTPVARPVVDQTRTWMKADSGVLGADAGPLDAESFGIMSADSGFGGPSGIRVSDVVIVRSPGSQEPSGPVHAPGYSIIDAGGLGSTSDSKCDDNIPETEE